MEVKGSQGTSRRASLQDVGTQQGQGQGQGHVFSTLTRVTGVGASGGAQMATAAAAGGSSSATASHRAARQVGSMSGSASPGLHGGTGSHLGTGDFPQGGLGGLGTRDSDLMRVGSVVSNAPGTVESSDADASSYGVEGSSGSSRVPSHVAAGSTARSTDRGSYGGGSAGAPADAIAAAVAGTALGSPPAPETGGTPARAHTRDLSIDALDNSLDRNDYGVREIKAVSDLDLDLQ